MSSIETELKFLFSKRDFKILYKYLRDNYHLISCKRQTNYYFDSQEKPLKQPLINIRIRYIKDKSEITLKVPIAASTTHTIQNSYEYNVNLNRVKAEEYIKNGLPLKELNNLFEDAFKEHGLKPFDMICFGHLKTSRISFKVNNYLPPILLDLNYYFGIYDYEVEWELDDVKEASNILNNIFNKLNIKSLGGLVPKRGRFFNKYFK